MFMSRFVYELVNGSTSGELVIDHINGDTLDNRIDNLRAVTHRKNSQNRRDQREEKTSSKYVGVYWHKQGHKWMSRIRINGFQKYIGLFDSEENARDAYQRALKETQ